MMNFRNYLFLLGSLLCPVKAQEPTLEAPPTPTLIEDDGVRVSVLGYHDFTSTSSETAMRISTTKFRKQMEAIRQSGIPVISMKDFCAWKSGNKEIPKKAIVITIDDGWKSTYTDAFPILKEYGYPFTIYLYKEYVDGGSKALSTAMIQEMMSHSAIIGSHSVSHPFPQVVKKHLKRGPIAYEAFLQTELGESKRFLEEKFSVSVPTYAYPGGFFTEEMHTKATLLGYTHLFTVQPGKVKKSDNNFTLPRYIILGNYDNYFDLAMAFRDSQTEILSASITAKTVKLPYPVEPQPGAIIPSRLPEIFVDFSHAQNIDPTTLKMHVAGFGQVPAVYSAENQRLSWTVNRRLRQPLTHVKVSWSDADGKTTLTPLRWSFQTDREAAYLPGE